MKRDVYEEVVRQLSLPVGVCPHPKQLLKRYEAHGVTLEALISIFSQENQYKVIKSNHLIKQRIQSYTDRYLNGGDILSLSVEADFPPCMLMRRILEFLLQGSKQVVGELMKQPGRMRVLLDQPELAPALLSRTAQHCSALPRGMDDFKHMHAADADQQQGQQQQQAEMCETGGMHQQDPSAPEATEARVDVSSHVSAGEVPTQVVRRPASHQQQQQSGCSVWQQRQRTMKCRCRHCTITQLQHDVCRCVLADASYSVLCDVARQAAGLEYELLLADKLRAAGVVWFWTEAQLRAQGYFKTPDVRLQVPIAVRASSRLQSSNTATDCSPAGSGKLAARQADSSWHVVCWIDSKATFGDDRIHNKQLEEQYATYVNRYGPGLVIYWFGFLDDLNTHADVLLMDHFPLEDELHVLPQAQLPPTMAVSNALQANNQLTSACS